METTRQTLKMSEINPLEIQTSSSTISLALELIKKGLRKGSIIGIGNDIGLWSALSPHADSLDIYESDPRWLAACKDFARSTLSSLHSQELDRLTFNSFTNHKYRSAAEQARYLHNQKIIGVAMAEGVVEQHPLYYSLKSKEPDWIYIDGPLGGYWSETEFQDAPDTGRMETILCAARCLSSSVSGEKWIIVDDCHRYIEKTTLQAISPWLYPVEGIRLGRNTLAFQVISQRVRTPVEASHVSMIF